MNKTKSQAVKRLSSGRPPKFRGPSRPVTVTLPERTLQQLASIDKDRAQAIVSATKAALGVPSGDRPLVDVIEACPGQAVIMVGKSKYLEKIDFLKMVEIAPLRYLLALPTGMAIESLEVAVQDLIDRLAPGEASERELLLELYRVLRMHRQLHDVSTAEILLFRLDVLPQTP